MCGSTDKQKGQHCNSKAHKKFLAAVQQAQAVEGTPNQAALQQPDPLLQDDPLELLHFVQAPVHSCSDSSDSEDEVDVEFCADETTGWFARTRPLSHTHAYCRRRH